MKFHIKKRPSANGAVYYFNIMLNGKALASSEPHLNSKASAISAIHAIWDGCGGTQNPETRALAIVDETGEPS